MKLLKYRGLSRAKARVFAKRKGVGFEYRNAVQSIKVYEPKVASDPLIMAMSTKCSCPPMLDALYEVFKAMYRRPSSQYDFTLLDYENDGYFKWQVTRKSG